MAKRNLVILPVETSQPARKSVARIKAKNRNILELDGKQARHFFFKHESYCNIDLPPYFRFDKLLSKVDKILSGSQISDFRRAKGVKPSDFEGVNHVILNNKNGKYAWRPLELIHPALYVSLVHKITAGDQWKVVLARFEEFRANPRIKCLSYPVESLTKQSDKAEQVFYWWQEIEQRSIEFALDYEYLVETDISDCYASIYTHSIPWALHGKEFSKRKENRKNDDLIGNVIDSHIQDMCYGQTNGLPQGSVLMDFIAEIVLGYADSLLSERLEQEGITQYQILRYRDDYRIFTNNPQEGAKVLKILTEILIELGLKLNPSKTNISSNVIRDSIKDDKLFWIMQNDKGLNLQKDLLKIHHLSEQYPNSGSLTATLSKYHKRIAKLKSTKENIIPLISIITDIAFHNPKSYPLSAAILSKFLSLITGNDQKAAILKRIVARFSSLPNIGHLQIWLQRITITFDKSWDAPEPLVQVVKGVPAKIWNTDWLAPRLAKVIDSNEIIDQDKLAAVTPVILETEVELFASSYGY